MTRKQSQSTYKGNASPLPALGIHLSSLFTPLVPTTKASLRNSYLERPPLSKLLALPAINSISLNNTMVASTWGCLDGERVEIETDKDMRRIVLAKVYGRLSFADITKSLNQLYGQGAFLEQRIRSSYLAVLDIYLNTEEGRDCYNFHHKLTDMFSDDAGSSEADILATVKEGLLWAENPAAEATSLRLYRKRNGYVEYDRCRTWALEQWEKGPLWELGN